MNSETTKYIDTQIEKVTAFRKVLTIESDRGCALFAAAYLDVGLSDLLYVSLVENKSIERDMFEGTSPLATFSSRIKMAYYLGLISLACRRNLDIIRSVRNDFAHKLDIDSFSSQSVRDRCRSLVFSYREKQDEPRSHFTASVMAVLGHINTATLTTISHVERSDDTPTSETKTKHHEQVEEYRRTLCEPTDRDASGE